jgi:hypothetical protein
MAEVIYHAWQNGARFDAWQDQFNFNTWMKVFDECHLEPSFYTHRIRSIDEIFPWDHISTGVRKKYLLNELKLSQNSQTRMDCREQCFACGILPTFADLRRTNPGDAWSCPEVKSPAKIKVQDPA